MRILVTGGNGFIGARVVHLLHARGHTIRCLLRPTSNTVRISGTPHERANGDIRSPTDLTRAMDGCDAVIHAASLSNWADLDRPELRDIIVGGTHNLIEALKTQGSKPLIFVGSASALGGSCSPEDRLNEDTTNPIDARLFRYASLKREAAMLCREAWESHRIPAVVVHPVETYGPGDTALVTGSTLIEFARGPLSLVCYGGTSIAHVDDVAEGIVRALERGHPGASYLLGGENLSIRAMAQTVHRILGLRHGIVGIPDWTLQATLRLLDLLPLRWAAANRTRYRYANRFWFIDNSRTCAELGLSFRSAEKTFRDTLNWMHDEKLIGRKPQ